MKEDSKSKWQQPNGEPFGPMEGKSPTPEGSTGDEETAQNPEKGTDQREQLLRLAAEFDNYKKRVRKEIESSKEQGMIEIIRDLLPVLDEFRIATLAAERSPDKEFAKGIALLYSNMIGVLTREGLKEIECDGACDPYSHEILLAMEVPGKKPGTIAEVIKPGYLFRGMPVRPASVIVVKGPEAKKDDGSAKKDDNATPDKKKNGKKEEAHEDSKKETGSK